MTIHSSFSDIDPTQWQELVKQSSTASFFQTPECYQFYASLSFMKPFVFGVSENGKLVGILSGYIISDGNIIKRYLSRRAIVCGGALLDEDVSLIALEQLLVSARKSLKRKAIYFEIRNYNNYSSYKSTFKAAGFDYSPHLNFNVLTPDRETALKQLNTTKRRDVKLSQNTGAIWNETSNTQDLIEYYEILSNLYKTRIKTPLFPFEFFQKLVLQQLGKLFIVKYEGKVIGGSVCVILPGKKIYEWFVCGMDGQIKNVYPSTVATWAAIEYTASNEYSYFDMMGAGKPDDAYGVREFKSKFGGNLIENGRFLCINNPLLFKIGKIAVSIIRSNKKSKKNQN